MAELERARVAAEGVLAVDEFARALASGESAAGDRRRRLAHVELIGDALVAQQSSRQVACARDLNCLSLNCRFLCRCLGAFSKPFDVNSPADSDRGLPSALPISLTDVQLASNRLMLVPPALLELTNLTKLDLSDNSLELLPNDFGRLAALVHLDLSNNGLKTLPASVAQLISLQTLTVTNNELTSLPTTVCFFFRRCAAQLSVRHAS